MILFFYEGGAEMAPPTLASVSMIVAKTTKDLFGNY